MTEAEARLKKIQRKRRCTHRHASGRMCHMPCGRNPLFCGLHADKAFNACAECVDMLRTFTPPKGW